MSSDELHFHFFNLMDCYFSAVHVKQNFYLMIQTLKTLLKERNSQKVEEFIETNPKVLDLKDENGSSGFFLIIYSGNPENISKAISLKSQFDYYEAIVSGKIELVKSNLDKSPNLINQYSSDGFSPVSLAAFFNQTEIAQYLISKGADPNLAATNPSKVNALHSAIARENEVLCRLFLQNGAHPDATQTQGVTALHSAAHRNNLNLVNLLLEFGATKNLKMDNGDDALTIAEREGHVELANILR